jgi:hypothetical protein
MSWIGDLWQKLVKSGAVQGNRKLVRTWWDSLDEEPYVVEIQVSPAAIDLSTLKVEKIRGLLAVYSVNTTPPGDLKLISHWRSAAAYTAWKSVFFSKSGIRVGWTVRAEGHQVQVAARPPKLGWLRRHAGALIGSVVGLLGVLAAIIGNVDKLRDPVLSLCMAPKVQITAVRESLDILSGEEFDAELTVRNVSDWVSCDVRFGDIRVQPPNAVSIDTSLPGPFIGLAPGGTEVVKIHGVAKSARPDSLINTQVEFAGEAENWIRTKKQALVAGNPNRPQLKLAVWPRSTVGVKQVGEVLQQGTRCRIDCQFMIGDEFAKGFEVQAQLRLPDGVRFKVIQFYGNPKLDSLPETSSSELTQVRWSAKDLKSGRRYQFSLFATSDRIRTEAQWRMVAQHTEITFGSLPTAK